MSLNTQQKCCLYVIVLLLQHLSFGLQNLLEKGKQHFPFLFVDLLLLYERSEEVGENYHWLRTSPFNDLEILFNELLSNGLRTAFDLIVNKEVDDRGRIVLDRGINPEISLKNPFGDEFKTVQSALLIL